MKIFSLCILLLVLYSSNYNAKKTDVALPWHVSGTLWSSHNAPSRCCCCWVWSWGQKTWSSGLHSECPVRQGLERSEPRFQLLERNKVSGNVEYRSYIHVLTTPSDLYLEKTETLFSGDLGSVWNVKKLKKPIHLHWTAVRAHSVIIKITKTKWESACQMMLLICWFPHKRHAHIYLRYLAT